MAINKSFQVALGQGTSMSPCIEPGDHVYYLSAPSAHDLHIGDIVIFSYGKILIAHRIVRITPKKVTTKGDNSLLMDTPVNFGDIKGKVVSIKKKHIVYDFTSRKAYLYNTYCLLYSLSLYYSYNLSIKLIKIIFSGKRILLQLLKSAP